MLKKYVFSIFVDIERNTSLKQPKIITLVNRVKAQNINSETGVLLEMSFESSCNYKFIST